MKRAAFFLLALIIVPMLHANAARTDAVNVRVKVEGVQGSGTPVFVKISWRYKYEGKDHSGVWEDTINGNGQYTFHQVSTIGVYQFVASASQNELCKRNCRVSQKFDRVPTTVIVLKFPS